MKQPGSDLYEQMARKLDILQKISNNTKIQIRFIQQRKLKGLLRLLRERAQYLQELTVLDIVVDCSDIIEPIDKEAFEKITVLIKAKQQEIAKDNSKVMEAARFERNRIAADLNRVRSQKKMRTFYCVRWINLTGQQVNQRG